MRFLRETRLAQHYTKLVQSNGADATPCVVDSFVQQNARFAEDILAPLNAVADAHGCVRVDERTVRTPPGFREAYAQWIAGGWFGMTFPERFGGQGLPPSLYIAIGEMLASANFTFAMFPGLSQGAVNTIMLHGSEKLKAKFLPPLVAGEWTGTMYEYIGADFNVVFACEFVCVCAYVCICACIHLYPCTRQGASRNPSVGVTCRKSPRGRPRLLTAAFTSPAPRFLSLVESTT